MLTSPGTEQTNGNHSNMIPDDNNPGLLTSVLYDVDITIPLPLNVLSVMLYTVVGFSVLVFSVCAEVFYISNKDVFPTENKVFQV